MSKNINRQKASALRLLEGMRKNKKSFDTSLNESSQFGHMEDHRNFESSVNRDFPSAKNEERHPYNPQKGQWGQLKNAPVPESHNFSSGDGSISAGCGECGHGLEKHTSDPAAQKYIK